MKIIEINVQTGKQSERDMTPEEIAALPAPPSVDDIRAQALEDVRSERAPILDALAGIAGRAARKGDTVTADAADQAAEDLLAITQLPTLIAATNYDDMKTAVMTRYREIAFAAPETVQTAFREVFPS